MRASLAGWIDIGSSAPNAEPTSRDEHMKPFLLLSASTIELISNDRFIAAKHPEKNRGRFFA